MKKLIECTDGTAEMIGVVVAGLVAIIVGVLVWFKLNQAMYTAAGVPARAAADGAPHLVQNATRGAITAVWNNTNATANTIWTLFPIVAIVVVAGVILAVVMGFGRPTA